MDSKYTKLILKIFGSNYKSIVFCSNSKAVAILSPILFACLIQLIK
jgi:hypothetical protein